MSEWERKAANRNMKKTTKTAVVALASLAERKTFQAKIFVDANENNRSM